MLFLFPKMGRKSKFNLSEFAIETKIPVFYNVKQKAG